MTNISAKILFFGTEDFSAASLSALIAAGYTIAAVVTKPDSKKGRGHKLSAPLVKEIALAHDIPVWQPQKLATIADDIKKLQPIAGVLVSYGKIIPQSIIDLFTPGIINVHPSLLPKYRGPSPIESAIVNGDATTGVSIMQLSSAMDAGPVYRQTRINLTGTETGPLLYKKLAQIGADELTSVLPTILAGLLQPTEQDDTQVTYCQLLTKADGELDPTRLTAAEAERRVRAYQTFPKTRLALDDRVVIVTNAHVVDQQKTPLDVAFSDGKFLSIDELIAPSGKAMSAEAYLRGYAK